MSSTTETLCLVLLIVLMLCGFLSLVYGGLFFAGALHLIGVACTCVLPRRFIAWATTQPLNLTAIFLLLAIPFVLLYLFMRDICVVVAAVGGVGMFLGPPF